MPLWVQRKEKEIVKAASGLNFDFRDSEFLQVGEGDADFFKLQGFKVIKSDGYPEKPAAPETAKAAPAQAEPPVQETEEAVFGKKRKKR